MATPAEGRRYRAFISYSHRDERVAARLHRRLESYRPPKGVVDGKGRLAPVFRDRDELASAAGLGASIEQALEGSDALIVVCSPAAVASQWVGQEIAWFRTHHPDRPVLAFVVGGEPGLDPRREPASAAFPPALVLGDPAQPEGPLLEPLAADAREQGDGFTLAFLKLAAGLLGVGFDDLRRRDLRRRQRRLVALSVASMLLTGVFAWLAWEATLARRDAEEAQTRAELELASERQTREFLTSVFQLADAGEARGNTVTVREVLDRAVARVDSTEFSRPAIKSRYLATMGLAYSSLGLNRRSIELLDQSIAVLKDAPLDPELQKQHADNLIEMAAIEVDTGEYENALSRLEAAESLGREDAALAPLQQVRVHNLRGDAYSFMESDAKAEAAYRQALALVQQSGGGSEPYLLEQSVSFHGLALLRYFSGDHASAEELFSESVRALESSVGETHPRTIATLISQGANAHAAAELSRATSIYERALTLALRVYDDHSPQIGTLKNNLGRLHLERGELDAAEPLLRDALDSDRRHRSAEFDDLSYSLNNLAVVRMAQGDAVEARTLLEEALPIAEKAQHPMLGPILANLADLDCGGDAVARGVERAARAQALDRERHGDEHWQVHYAALVEAACRARMGERVDAAAVEEHRGAVEKRWPEANPFTQRARALARGATR